jgi:integrase
VTDADLVTHRAQFAHQQRERNKPVPVAQWGGDYAARLEGDWQRLLQLDLASSTHRSYAYHQRQYSEFCRLMGRRELPDPHTLAQFVVGRAQHGYALSTIEQGVYAVQRWGSDLGLEPVSRHGEVRRALKVAAKVAVPAGRQKLPLDRRDLRSIVYEMASRGQQDYVAVRDRALMLLGWAGMFRSSELVGIEWEHLRFSGTGVMIYVPRSKTDQAGKGEWVFVASCAREGRMCPVRALQWLEQFYIQLGGAEPSGPVFRGRPQSQVALSKTTVAVRLRKWLDVVGVSGSELYAAHSLRRGGATWAVRQDVPLRQVQVMGRWQSDVVREYLYCSPSAMYEASSRQQRG